MTPTPSPDPKRCPECGYGAPGRKDCTGCDALFSTRPAAAPGEGTERRGGAADCVRRSHWIGSKVGKADPGYGHDGGFSKTPCVPYEVAADCDPIALCTVTPPTPQPPVPLSPAPQVDGLADALRDALLNDSDAPSSPVGSPGSAGSWRPHRRNYAASATSATTSTPATCPGAPSPTPVRRSARTTAAATSDPREPAHE